MAYKRFSLRPLRLTHRTTDDMTEYMDVPRGLVEAEEIPQQRSILPEDDVEDTPDDIPHGLPPTDLEEPTSYELESKASVAAWEKIRQSIRHVVTESHALQIGQKCKRNLLFCDACNVVPQHFSVKTVFQIFTNTSTLFM